MSMAWETTVEDVAHVLGFHLRLTHEEIDSAHSNLDFEAIEEAVLYYDSMDDQCQAMYNEIENQLMEDGVIETKEKKFSCV